MYRDGTGPNLSEHGRCRGDPSTFQIIIATVFVIGLLAHQVIRLVRYLVMMLPYKREHKKKSTVTRQL